MGQKRKHRKSYRSNPTELLRPNSEVTKVQEIETEPGEVTAELVTQNKHDWFLSAGFAVLVITLLGFAVFSAGLKNQFVGDDLGQIVNNPVVHSVSNIRLLFEGSTFYNGNGLAPLSGAYYRPLMSTVFSIIYTAFGAHTFAYHFVQLLLCIGSAILLYLVFRYSFKPVVSLVLAAIFIVHPLNSQAVFAIASMQDALFFFFGILAIWLLLRFHSVRSLILVVLSLLLSLLAKEAAGLFIIVALAYLLIFDRKRLLPFLGILALPAVLYVSLKINAVGFDPKTAAGPIDKLSFLGRLLTLPSVFLFYFSKLIFPWGLASSYYWTYPHFSFSHVLLPLIIDLLIIYVAVYAGIEIRTRNSKAMFATYVFFGVWAAVGIVPYLQIVPLDMTACTTWFYMSMAGILGMLGVILDTFRQHLNPKWFLVAGAIVVLLFGVRSGIDARDWSSDFAVANHNISVSTDNYPSYNELATYYINDGEYEKAKPFVQRSISIYPSFTNYEDLGTILASESNYSGAVKAYYNGLKYGDSAQIYENIGLLSLVDGANGADMQYLTYTLQSHPNDYILWEYLALAYARNGDTSHAQAAITKARSLGTIQQALYNNIMTGQSFTLNLTSIHKSIYIP